MVAAQVLRHPTVPLAAAGAAILAYALALAGPYELRVLTLAGTYVLLVAGYQLVFGHAGALSLAQGAFFGLGAYATAILSTALGQPAALTLPASAAVAALVAAAVGRMVLRLETHYFALATLVLAEGARLVATNWVGLTGGANGIAGIPPVEIAGVAFGRGLPLAALVWAAAAAGCTGVWLATRGTAGLAYTALRERPQAAASLGLDLARMRFFAFVAGAALAGAAGALHAHVVGVVSPDALDLPVMVACLMMTVIGGRTRVSGAIIGALILAHLPEWFRGLGRGYLVAYGAAALVMVIAAPDGLAGAFERLWRRLLPVPPPPLPSPIPLPPRALPGGTVLAAEAIAKSYGGVRALDGVDIAVGAGEILGLIGPNGSGKTTFANIATGHATADSGRVRLGAEDITGLRAHAIARLGVARTFQTAQLVDGAGALDNVALAVWARPGAAMRADAVRAEARAHLDAFGFVEDGRAPSSTLPAGARRRVEIARAAALCPRLIVLDEPSAGLAPPEQETLAAALRARAAEGTAVLVIDHDMKFLLGLADRVVCLAEGRVVASGTPAAVRADARVRAVYLGHPSGPAAP